MFTYKLGSQCTKPPAEATRFGFSQFKIIRDRLTMIGSNADFDAHDQIANFKAVQLELAALQSKPENVNWNNWTQIDE